MRNRPEVPGLGRLTALPWAVGLQAGVMASEHWRSLSDRDRSRFLRLLRDARGRPGNLTSREREELRELIDKFDVPGLGRELLPLARGTRRRP